MKFKIKKGIVEVPSNNDYSRSFKVPPGKNQITSVNVYWSKRSIYYSMVISFQKGTNKTYRNLSEKEVIYNLEQLGREADLK